MLHSACGVRLGVCCAAEPPVHRLGAVRNTRQVDLVRFSRLFWPSLSIRRRILPSVLVQYVHQQRIYCVLYKIPVFVGTRSSKCGSRSNLPINDKASKVRSRYLCPFAPFPSCCLSVASASLPLPPSLPVSAPVTFHLFRRGWGGLPLGSLQVVIPPGLQTQSPHEVYHLFLCQ